jgi:cytochrome c-type biogenesis protein CcmH
MRQLLFLLLLLWTAPLAAQLQPADRPLADPVAERQAQELMAELRCLQCQNQSIADSAAPQAATMRAIVRQQIAAGMSPDSVRRWFIDRYGDWVSFDPPARGASLLLWLAPVAVLLCGAFLARRLFGKGA